MATSGSGVTVNHNDHVAAAAYLMKHTGTTVLFVLDGQWPGRLIGTITEDDIAAAAASGQDLNDVRLRDLMADANSREAGTPGPAAAAVLQARSGLPTESRLATCAGQFADSGRPARHGR